MAQQYSTSTHWVAAMHLNNTGNSRSSPKNNTGWSWFSPHETCNMLGIPVGKSTYHLLGYKSYMSDRIQRNGWFVWYLISSVAKVQGKNIYNYIYICVCMHRLVCIPTKLNLPCFHHYCLSYELGLSYSTHIWWIPNCPSLSAPFASWKNLDAPAQRPPALRWRRGSRCAPVALCLRPGDGRDRWKVRPLRPRRTWWV